MCVSTVAVHSSPHVDYQVPITKTTTTITTPKKTALKRSDPSPRAVLKRVVSRSSTGKPRMKKKNVVITKTQERPVDSKTSFPLPSFHMTPCAMDYFKALYNPFDLGINPCIPGLFPLPSQKFCVRTRGTFQVGSDGYGGIAFWPWRMLSRSQIRWNAASWLPAVVSTTNTFTVAGGYDFTNSCAIMDAATTAVGYTGDRKSVV